MSFRVAVVQFKITHLDREKNFQRIERFIQRAVSKKAQVIVFPEDCVTGSIFGDLSKLDHGENRKHWQALARRYHIDIITGSSMEGTSEGNFNTSYYIDARGAVLGRYRKNHLYPSEYKFLQPGTDVPVFETAYGKAGIVICWDLLFSEMFARMKAQGVQIIYCPSYWYREIAEPMHVAHPHSEERLLDALCLTRSVETNAVFVYANAAGVMRYSNGSKDTLTGHSQIVLPVLGAIDRFSHRREKMIIRDIALDSLEVSRHIYRER